MITKTINDNIFKTKEKHIAFAINKEGLNDAGFAGQIAYNYWNKINDCKEREIGTVLSKKVGNITYHALVCFSLEDGWPENQKEVIEECFNNIDSKGKPIATVAIGTGYVGILTGADFKKIVCGMNDSVQDIVLYAPYTLEEIKDIYEEEKSYKRKRKR